MILQNLVAWLRDLFNLNNYKSRSDEVIESIRNNVEFKGTNLWILIFAILIASIGLNVNSAAVIIGAMLISPLMGPILGMGLGAGIYDFRLLKKAAKNLAVAAGISILTAALYFLITPIKTAQSELLARTTPTVWDVLIGFLGGLAGIIAISSKEKGNVIPGVAIATALIPPLCTAGYGLAIGNIYYFFGAFYLFLINTVFICFATTLIVKYLRFPHKTFVDEATGKRVKRTVTTIVIITIIPSVFIAYRLVLKNLYNNHVDDFVREELMLPGTYVGHKEVDFRTKTIDVFLMGQRLDSLELKHIELKMAKYELGGSTLNIKQGEEKAAQINITADVDLLQDMVRRSTAEADNKQRIIDSLEQVHKELRNQTYPTQDILDEMKAQGYPVSELSLTHSKLLNDSTKTSDELCMALIVVNKPLETSQQVTLKRWLQVRTKTTELRMFIKEKGEYDDTFN